MKERSEQDRKWIEQKMENERINRLLFSGWDGKIWRRGIPARIVFKGLINGENQTILS